MRKAKNDINIKNINTNDTNAEKANISKSNSMIKKENTCNIINISKILESNYNQKLKIRNGANIEKSLADTKNNKEFKRKKFIYKCSNSSY